MRNINKNDSNCVLITGAAGNPEKKLFEKCAANQIEAVSLQAGMIYGKGILMIDAALWFAKYYLLRIWKKSTYIHLISKEDFIASVTVAIEKPNIQGIYHVDDDGIQTLQEFLDTITQYKGNHKPRCMPVWMILLVAMGTTCMYLAIKTIQRNQQRIIQAIIAIILICFSCKKNEKREVQEIKFDFPAIIDALQAKIPTVGEWKLKMNKDYFFYLLLS